MDIEERKNRAKDSFSGFLKAKGGRCTPERMAILEEVVEVKSKFTIDELEQRLQERHFPVAHGTLYNTIRELLDARLVRRLQTGRIAHYQFCDGKTPNFHQICVRCGKIVEFVLPEVENLLQTYRPRRFTMQEFSVTISGVCSTCMALQRKLERKNNKNKKQ